MSVRNQIDLDLKEAMKNKDQETLGVLRLLKSAITNAEIAKKGELDDTEVLSVIEKQAKQRKDSIEQYKSGNREDLAQKEEAELLIISNYLPQKMTREEAEKFISAIITEIGASQMSQMGEVMKIVREKANGQIDGAMASEIVKGKLG